MAYELEPAQIAEIDSKLPPQFAALKDKYPLTISNVAECWNLPAYPAGYVPEFIDIYYDDDDASQAAVTIKDGKLSYIELEDPVIDPALICLTIEDPVTDPALVYLTIEDDPAYVQIEGRVIFNRLGGALLPDVLLNPEVLLKSILGGISA